MALAKQAKILTKQQTDAVLAYLSKTRYPERNRVIFLLSVRAGLRAKEIASLKWEMVTDVEGCLAEVIALTNDASKGRKGGRIIPLSKELRVALGVLKAEAEMALRPSSFVIVTERAANTLSVVR